jgi:hypothetical protein
MGYRPRVRPHTAARYDLYPPTTTLGWRVIKLVTAAEVKDALDRGLWREVYDEHGDLAGYQIKTNFQTDDDLPSGWSSCAISENEMDLVAGTKFSKGRSRTQGLPEAKKMARKDQNGKALAPEDAVERAVAKVKAWPYPASRVDNGEGKPVFGDRAVRVYPKPGLAEG